MGNCNHCRLCNLGLPVCCIGSWQKSVSTGAWLQQRTESLRSASQTKQTARCICQTSISLSMQHEQRGASCNVEEPGVERRHKVSAPTDRLATLHHASLSSPPRAFDCRYQGLVNKGKLHSHGVLRFPSNDRYAGAPADTIDPLLCCFVLLAPKPQQALMQTAPCAKPSKTANIKLPPHPINQTTAPVQPPPLLE